MADCTKTVEFIRELVRMCDSNNMCNGCPLQNEYESCYGTPSEYLSEDAITIVQKWSDEQPVLTWEGKLRELLPNVDARIVCNALCPYDIFGGDAPKKGTCACDTYVD